MSTTTRLWSTTMNTNTTTAITTTTTPRGTTATRIHIFTASWFTPILTCPTSTTVTDTHNCRLVGRVGCLELCSGVKAQDEGAGRHQVESGRPSSIPGRELKGARTTSSR